MTFFSKNTKKISTVIIFSLLFSVSPSFSSLTNAQTQAVDTTAGATMVTAAEIISVEAPPCPLALGTGLQCNADYGVRFNTLSILASTVGVAPGAAMKESVWDSIAYFMGRILVRQLSQSIVDWINSGFQGNPSFIQDPQQFLTDSADRVIGEFIFASDLKALCDPFEINVRVNLGLGYSPFKDKINCTLSEVLQNTDGAVTQAYNDFMNGDFINGGGWDSWLNITTQPQNNQLGAMLIAQAELDAQVADKKVADKDELNWGSGLLSMKECTRTTYDADGKPVGEPKKFTGSAVFETPGTTQTETNFRATETNTYAGNTKDVCKITTPGSFIADSGKRALGLDMDQLGVADEINEIVGALANFVITKVMEKGLAMVKKEDLSTDNASWRDGITELQRQQASDIGSAGSDSSFQPDYASYGSGASSNTTGNSGVGVTNPVITNDPQVNALKTELNNKINLLRGPEQNYRNSHDYIYTLISLVEKEFNTVITCYEEKKDSETLNLTSSEINTANNRIDDASEEITDLSSPKNSSAAQILASQGNLTKLQTIQNAVNLATTMDALAIQQTALTNLEKDLHNAAAATNAASLADSTGTTMTNKANTAVEAQKECEDFAL